MDFSLDWISIIKSFAPYILAFLAIYGYIKRDFIMGYYNRPQIKLKPAIKTFVKNKSAKYPMEQ